MPLLHLVNFAIHFILVVMTRNTKIIYGVFLSLALSESAIRRRQQRIWYSGQCESLSEQIRMKWVYALFCVGNLFINNKIYQLWKK